ncbi:hypothetical protein TSH100_08800 [Azospirillum sp. TSH100]|uniref:hypothetical protein n=1 Tax=Azospirillum sp. TSH100 TaxID=652764 RepID=UPI000D60EC91|nr:hypothetical protein [Azospirillum sp. TSH100]PWC87980.1 hypothetical protein TSH100_08800 [Azospirillum sp. TSH100]QCG92255.1 hypothetical protein E6C72_31195 [Azospirillum sp. TSH100]
MTAPPHLPILPATRDADALDATFLPHPPIALAVARRLVPWWRALQRNAPANTTRALWADARHYIRWCANQGRVAVPAGPETVIAYLTVLANDGGRDGQPAAYGTVARRKSTIAALHEAAGQPDPCRDRLVRLEMKGLAVRLGRRPAQAVGLRRDDVQEMLTALDRIADGSGDRADEPAAVRDAALIAVGYDTLRRRAELVRLTIADIQTERDGSGRLFVARSKTDQAGQGRWCWLGPDSMVRLQRWLRLRALLLDEALAEGERLMRRCAPSQGSSNRFENTARHDRLLRRQARLEACREVLWLQIGTDRLARRTGAVLGPLAVAGPDPGKRVGEIFKARAKAVGLEGSGVPGEGAVSGHSLRVGGAQDLLAAGFGLPAIQQAGDWTSPAMPARYGERIAAGTGAMAQLAEKQGRSGGKA